ncbi:hypothetical protein MEN41_00660 [Dolichospermum sp. ST_con]|jgi:hypothetical protein|nr:hypothetical protein [Dolichospermum sp. ST_con]MDD1418369.1 hypothetical protein [Dolichospermum sp. ST_sed1]MDD1426253.1 hypothetical protein [Dolichospermum sp. ST_sed9]MDD1431435.1 hypothetical protein [Dolichospermum sp. ST_sed6]MDD1442129.1 hypothetical protein [Dolichospermum sp. ST_sed3]MDD1445632.1 hypothetical protein [Dolichospermum sp. ST_sed8]MDD1461995.1 hypothetical protein [Dolichospermum sp. ST_sed2]MDD1473112.1 hypothetical protein [Dolichospermum sp. ST_sed4]
MVTKSDLNLVMDKNVELVSCQLPVVNHGNHINQRLNCDFEDFCDFCD